MTNNYTAECSADIDAMPLNCSGMFRGVIKSDTGIAKVAIWASDELEEIR